MYHSVLLKNPLNKVVCKIGTSLPVFLLLSLAISPEFAVAEGGAPMPSLGQIIAKMVPMLIMVFFIFYFMVVKPQQAKLKTHEEMIKSLQKGDKVSTAGGIIGRVSEVAEDGISLEIAPGVKVKFLASKISKKLDTEEASKKAA